MCIRGGVRRMKFFMVCNALPLFNCNKL